MRPGSPLFEPQSSTTWGSPDDTLEMVSPVPVDGGTSFEPRPRPSVRTGRVLVGLALLATAVVNPSALAIVPFLFVLVVPFEKLFPRHRQRLRRSGLGTDLAYAVLSGPLKVIGTVVGIPLVVLSLIWIPALALRAPVAALPGPAQVVLGVLLFDVLGYWVHRWMHEIPLLWRFHAIHHSPRQLDWVSGVRSHPLDGIPFAPIYGVLLAAGFDGKLTGGLLLAQTVFTFYVHANVRWRLRPLQRLIITPEFHHWHHCADPRAMNSNYSALLPIWDILFGTWYMPADRRPGGYGMNEPIPEGLVQQLLYPLRGLGAPTWQVLRHPWQVGLPALWSLIKQIVAVTRIRATPLP
jgi:sterol desaturase/sphingolipid hydroxylase (fatty acid hydroxylase superfamily)